MASIYKYSNDESAIVPSPPTKQMGVCYCLECNVFMGWNNPRQLCNKLNCNNPNTWYAYNEHTIMNNLQVSVENKLVAMYEYGTYTNQWTLIDSDNDNYSEEEKPDSIS